MQKRLFLLLLPGVLAASLSLFSQDLSTCSADLNCASSSSEQKSQAAESVHVGQTAAGDLSTTGQAQSMGGRGLSSTPSAAAASSEFSPLRSQSAEMQFSTQAPPPPPSEFQKFVAATTGKRLTIFGAELFRKTPAAFFPSNLTPASASYLIGPDDELRVRVWGAINYSGNLRVDRSGNIFLPQVGTVHVAGVKFAELDRILRAAVGRVYRNFDLTADLGRIRSIQVYVTGQARQPGMYTISSLSTLVDALFASGGPSPSGSLRHVQLKRDGKTVVDFDLYAFLLGGDKSKDVQLLPEDVLYIPPVGPQAAILGSVHNPAIFELNDGETVADLLLDAGKTSAMTANSKVTLDRVDANQRRAMDFALDQAGLSVKLSDGDILRVYSILPSYRNTVMLRGNVANAGRYGWREGMHLSDLLPDREALLSRDYWWKRSHLGLGAPEFEAAVAPGDPLLSELSSNKLPDALSGGAQDAYSDNLQRGQSGNALSNSQNNPTSPNPLLDNSASNPSSLVQGQGKSAMAPYGQTGGQSSAFASIAQQNVPGDLNKQQAQKTLVRVTPNQIYWDHAVIERVDPITFKTALLSFDLGKLVNEHDAAQDLALEAGDTITIYSQDDIRVPEAKQTKYITLEGEVVHAGAYSVNPGETLRDVVRRAGGLTERAYLYGAEFDRESTRKLQQQRIDEYVRSVELETTRSSVAFANYAALSNQGGGAGNSSIAQQFVAQLRQIRATGRVVLKMKPDSRSIDDLPALSLENGDRLIIPAAPSTVNVVGAVYDQNTFLYEKSGSVGRYLKLAGGTNRNADAKRAFVIRADGSVLSHMDNKTIFSNEFAKAKLFPGDTIMVPDKNFRPNLGLKNVLEWTQMFSQLAMGAATISLLQ